MLPSLHNSEEVHFREAAKAQGLVPINVTQSVPPGDRSRWAWLLPQAMRIYSARVVQGLTLGSGPCSKAGVSGKVIQKEETVLPRNLWGPRQCPTALLATRQAPAQSTFSLPWIPSWVRSGWVRSPRLLAKPGLSANLQRSVKGDIGVWLGLQDADQLEDATGRLALWKELEGA